MLTMRRLVPDLKMLFRGRASFRHLDSVTRVTLVRVCAVAAALLSAPASAQQADRIPQIGLAGDDLDACLSVGRVHALNPRGDNYLAVRARPATTAREKDRLGPKREVWICENSGEWMGVVYDPDAAEGAGDCGVGTPSAKVQPYAGACRWGWVHSRYVVVIAG